LLSWEGVDPVIHAHSEAKYLKLSQAAGSPTVRGSWLLLRGLLELCPRAWIRGRAGQQVRDSRGGSDGASGGAGTAAVNGVVQLVSVHVALKPRPAARVGPPMKQRQRPAW